MREMDDDAIAEALNLEHAIDVDLLEPAKSILLAQLASARRAAIVATAALIDADPHNVAQLMTLQNEVRRFTGLTTWLLNARTRAREAFALLPQDEQDAVRAFTNPHHGINDA
jgi:hypothetical protein